MQILAEQLAEALGSVQWSGQVQSAATADVQPPHEAVAFVTVPPPYPTSGKVQAQRRGNESRSAIMAPRVHRASAVAGVGVKTLLGTHGMRSYHDALVENGT